METLAEQGCPTGPVLGPSEEGLWGWTGQVTQGGRVSVGKSTEGGREEQIRVPAVPRTAMWPRACY